MYIASAYPNSALSALSMMAIGFVVVGALAACIALVFIADREPRGQRVAPASQRGAPPSGLRSDDAGGATREDGGLRRPGGEWDEQSERDKQGERENRAA
jgi:hypothetical protein